MQTEKSSSRTDLGDAAEPAFNAGDAASVAERKGKSKRLEERRANGLRQIMASPDGRAWLWALLGSCEIFSPCFTGNSTTFFNEGKRAVGLPVFHQVTEEFPEQYLLMAKEAKQNV
ncbi:hypothetical protein IST4116A_01210 [Burkholderia cenocepacia]|uniref:Bbp19 family protein n=1 Tax=Burkholderia cenocepacia TaxID=95486 RepID=UPI0019840BF0|nr:hypothetical protein [Burkholderia cenocepacia]CAB5083034.1 hypothetical protein IST4116B_01202 [Burkholderia cenocepacia]CAB5083715.1 hypothetical protein IST4134_01211 [Burkholderia cenocepacia]CAB5087810.1 hypothetical protein IST4113_01209 [Burkholderia cenocepacia]CAB5095835.1 hypothetical protein IST439_01249 [Burkholderia cenocepacia]CAB5105255.1 hypothetical protein IST4129_01210 [Burkholderia cenocepacia]